MCAARRQAWKGNCVKIGIFWLFSGQLSIDNGGPIDNDFGSSIPNLGNDNGQSINPPPQTIGGNIEVSNDPVVGPIGGGNGGSDASSINGIGAGSNGSWISIAWLTQELSRNLASEMGIHS